MGLYAAFLGAIISGFGSAIGWGLAVAMARQIPAVTEKLRSVDTEPARHWFRQKARATIEARQQHYATVSRWLKILAVGFTIITGGFGLIGLLIGWGLYRLGRKNREHQQQREQEPAHIDVQRKL